MRGNGALCRGRPAWLLGVLAAGVLWLAPASASAALVWSAPVFLNAGADSGLVDLACPTSTLCVAVDSAGREVSFDPADPSAWSAYAIDRTRALTGVACPAASECVAVDGQGAAITFDPEQAGSASRRYVISRGPLQVPAPGNALAAVSCASTGLCIAVDQQGHVIGFSPVGPPDARIAPFSAEQTLGGQHLVACPASTQCSVLSDTGTGTAPRSPTQTLITFDPRSLAAVATIAVPSSVSLTQLVCPTMSECIGAGSSLSVVGGQLAGNGTATVTFDPTSSTAGPAVVRGEVGNVALSCASASVCTAMDASGAEVSFDPNGSGVLEQAAVDPLGDYPKGFNGARIACPSADECVLATLERLRRDHVRASVPGDAGTGPDRRWRTDRRRRLSGAWRVRRRREHTICLCPRDHQSRGTVRFALANPPRRDRPAERHRQGHRLPHAHTVHSRRDPDPRVRRLLDDPQHRRDDIQPIQAAAPICVWVLRDQDRQDHSRWAGLSERARVHRGRQAGTRGDL